MRSFLNKPLADGSFVRHFLTGRSSCDVFTSKATNQQMYIF
jgi:hypothetical protein